MIENLPPTEAVSDLPILANAPTGSTLYDDLNDADKLRAYNKAQAYVLSRFTSATTIDDLPQVVQDIITNANAEHPAQVLWALSTNQASIDWVNEQTLLYAKQRAYMPSEMAQNVQVEQL